MSPRDALFDLAKPRVKRSAIDLLDQIRAAGLPDPEPEVQFAKAILGRNWAFDWSWRAYKLALEIEGSLFGRVINVGEGAFEYRTIRGERAHLPVAPHTIVRLGGRHNSGAGQNADALKYNYAAILGWHVIRCSTAMVRDNQVVPLLVLAFQQRGLKVVMPEKVEVPF
jgi:hypothetical protein